MTAPDLDALEALLGKATPGPWGQEPFGLIVSQEENESGKHALIADPTGDANAALIVAAVNSLPALIARVRELERERVHAIASARRDAEHDAALAMRERCAQACEKVRDKSSGTATECIAAIRALKP